MAKLTKNQKHIQAVLDLATAADVVQGKGWYESAFAIAGALAVNYGVSFKKAAGVLAALSPRNKWERNVIDAEKIIAAYAAAGSEAAEEIKVCTFSSNKAKAIRILELRDVEASAPDIANILSGPKLREFFNCIIGLEDVCIDGHAYAIWFGERVTLANVPSIGVKLRRAIKADYIAVAEANGLKAYEVQAITWVAWRRLHDVA